MSDFDRIGGHEEEARIAGLRWMLSCNKAGIGYLWESVRRGHQFLEYDPLIETRLAVLLSPDGRGKQCGYWITSEGKKVLKEHERVSRANLDVLSLCDRETAFVTVDPSAGPSTTSLP